jgi:hypothetical protein
MIQIKKDFIALRMAINKQLNIMSTKIKIFNWLLLLVIIMLIFMSTIALISIHLVLYLKYYFSFTPEGIDNYLSLFGQYKGVFTATITTIAAYLGLYRLKAATDANSDKLKQDRFTEWKTGLEIRLFKIEKSDQVMRDVFIKERYNLFVQLYDLNFVINNKTQLTMVFRSIFQNLVTPFELNNVKYNDMGGVYPNRIYSYSFQSFLYLFRGSINENTNYIQINEDLNNLYLDALNPNREIDKELYKIAQLRLSR